VSIRTVLTALLLAACAACSASKGADPARGQGERDERGYLQPPAVLTAQAAPDGAFRIEGVAQPGSKVRLIQADNSVLATQTDSDGHWTLSVPAAPAVRLFVETMTSGARTVAGEGYLMLAPDGRAAQLRAGSASQVLAPASARPRILSVDFDRDGGAIIGGVAPAGSGMNIRVDRIATGDVTANVQGRFVAAIRQKLRPGSHLIDISGDAGGDQIVVNVDRVAPPPAGAPFQAQRLERAWRVDWVTPAGGLQSSIVVSRVETGA
jgi:hypothetical protein